MNLIGNDNRVSHFNRNSQIFMSEAIQYELAIHSGIWYQWTQAVWYQINQSNFFIQK